MPGGVLSPAFPLDRGAQLTKEVAYLNMREAANASQLDKLWSDTFLTKVGIDAANSLRYLYRGSANYDVIPSPRTNPVLLNLNGSNGSQVFTNSGSGGQTFSQVNGAALSTAQKKWGTASLALVAASSQYIQASDHADFTPAGDFTFECYAYFSSKTTDRALFSQHQDGNNYMAFRWETGNVLRFKVITGGSITINISKSWNPSLNTWYHIQLVRSGNNFLFFVDGTQVSSTSSDSDPIPDFNAPLAIGFSYSDTLGAGCFFDGYIDDVRFCKDFARNTADFTAPTAELTDDGGTLAVLRSVLITMPTAITSVIVFADVTNGPADLYEISTDNGSTWTTITSANIGKIVTVPSGTQVILRFSFGSTKQLESWGVAAA